ncbi:hypothetical protein NLG97_g9483 [Lecanicillium saksenae]|uniref:Uncharacterized protein n=1 Tax=Lecanicillium saksenae TaxID=468837 RepID=A0ACC1QHQ8_9HYPO|nr:hypothetical protein NLG97_g9483 [Lecanicillium saksenae]
MPATIDGNNGIVLRRKKPIAAWRLAIIFACIGMGLFLSLLDATVVATMLVDISQEFQDFKTSSWVVLAYTLTEVETIKTGFAVAMARLSDALGRKTIVVASFAIFLAASMGCAASANLDQLVGFRNHSAPTDLTYGGSWTEDILWLEPDISCTRNNLSMHLKVSAKTSTNTTAYTELFDDGGFASLGAVNVVQGWPMLNYSQPDVKFLSRKSAQMHNVLAAMLFNLTDAKNAKYGINVTAGASYPVDSLGFSVSRKLEFQTFDFDGKYIGAFYNSTYVNGTLKINGSAVANPNDYPRELGYTLFLDASKWCEGRFNTDATPPRQSNVICGQMFGIPERTDNGETLLRDPGSKWKMPINTCAGALKASIRTVSFASNGSSSLELVKVTASKEKSYASAKEYPVWAYEDFGQYQKTPNASTIPLWGLVDSSYSGTLGYNFIQSPFFYLPQISEYAYGSNGAPYDMSAAAAAPLGILRIAMQGVNSGGAGSSYTGSESVALSNKWRLLSEKTGSQAAALRLIWTDLMANAVLGTNGGFSPPAQDGHASDDFGQRTVVPFKRRIVYDMRYAIPAIIALAVWAALLLGALVMTCVRPGMYTRLRHMLNDTCVGRVATNHMQDRKPLSRASTKEWQKNAGGVQIVLGESELPSVDDETPLVDSAPTKLGGNVESFPMVPQK